MRVGQKSLASRNKKESLLLPPRIQILSDWGVTRRVIAQSYFFEEKLNIFLVRGFPLFFFAFFRYNREARLF